ncbi:hypothetical protein PFISCL1PPCAC_19722, partial [Pristionchus fissidentatus]
EYQALCVLFCERVPTTRGIGGGLSNPRYCLNCFASTLTSWCSAMTEANRGTSLVTLVPQSEITFKGPYTDVVTSYLKIQNPQSKTICFKVKTTAPKQYCVRPNSGVLKPGDSTSVSVMLQPIDTIPSDAAKHKFMVQSCYAPGEGIDIDAFWKTVNPTDLHYGKLRVVFENGSGVITRPSPSVGAGDSEDSFDRVATTPSTRAPMSGASGVSSGGEDKTRRLEAEIERLQRERTELLLKVQAANAKVAQAGGDYPISTIQMILIVMAGLLIGLIVGKLF